MRQIPHNPFTLLLLLFLLPATRPQIKASPWLSDSLQVPHWARQYDSFSRSEDVYIVSKGDKKGVVSFTGKPITQLEYDTILPFRESMAIVGRLWRSRFKTSGKYGFINKNGKLVIPMEHYFINSFSEGLAVMSDGWCHFRYINKEGKKVLSFWAFEAGDFQGGMARTVFRHDSTGIQLSVDSAGIQLPADATHQGLKLNFMDHRGNLLIPSKYDSIGEYIYYGVRTIKRHGKYGFLDTTGKEVLPPVLDDIDYDSSFFWGSLRRVGRYGKFGFMDTYTGRLIVPVRYQGSLPSQDSLTWLKLNGKWGYVSCSQRAIIPFQYDQVSAFTEGLARVGKDGKFGHVNKQGEVITPLQYDNALPFREGRAMVVAGNRCDFVDTKGEEVIPVVYTSGPALF
jgi:hypothetical protein